MPPNSAFQIGILMPALIALIMPLTMRLFFALSANGFKDDQNGHEWVQRMFSGELVLRRKVFQNHFKSYIFDLMETRLIADYALTSVSQKKAERMLKRQKNLLQTLQGDINHEKSKNVRIGIRGHGKSARTFSRSQLPTLSQQS